MDKMNRQWVLGNLRETIDHIESAIAAIEKGNTHALDSWIEFIYRDLNRAWNGRHMSFEECNDEDDRIRRFPRDVNFDD